MKIQNYLLIGLCSFGLSYSLAAEESESSESTSQKESRPKGERPHFPMHREGPPIPPEIIEKFDQDKDGKLNPEEIKQAKEEMRGKMKERRGEFRDEMQEEHKENILKRYDKNGDGKLSDSEQSKMEKDRVEEVKQELIKEYDKNGNGRLDSAEKTAIKEDAKIQKGKFWWYNKPGPHPLKEILD